MGAFSNELQSILDELGMSQAEFAEVSGIAQSQMSRYINGSVQPSPDLLEKLCVTLDMPKRARLAAAHLSDELPESARELVQIVLTTARAEDEASVNYRAKMPKHLREVFDYFERQAMKDPDFAEWLSGTYKLMRG